MKNFAMIKSIFPFFVFVILISITVSCGSSQKASSDDDGIYDSNQTEKIVVVKDTKSDYYQNYFSNEKEYYDTDEDEIFTDIDEYGYSDADQDTLYVADQYNSGAAPWEYATDVTVNFYGGGYWGGCGFNNPWRWGWGCGWGWGFYNPWRWGWGWGWGFYNPWRWGWGWGWAWGGHNPSYGNSTYGKRYANNTRGFGDGDGYNRTSSTRDNRYSTSAMGRSASRSNDRLSTARSTSRNLNSTNTLRSSDNYVTSRNYNNSTSSSRISGSKSTSVRRSTSQQYSRGNTQRGNTTYITNNNSRSKYSSLNDGRTRQRVSYTSANRTLNKTGATRTQNYSTNRARTGNYQKSSGNYKRSTNSRSSSSAPRSFSRSSSRSSGSSGGSRGSSSGGGGSRSSGSSRSR